MHTVVPANKTARPDVLTASDYRVRHAHPVQQVAAVSRDDEEGIVDPHADHHQLRQLWCHSGHVHDVAQQRNDTQPADQCRDRAGERQRNRTNRPEHDSEDDERGNESPASLGILRRPMIPFALRRRRR